MGVDEDIGVRLTAQRALLTHVTPQLRAVSLDIDAEQHCVWVRFIFDGQPSESVRDAAACAGTEILSDYPEGWDIREEFIVCPAPGDMKHLRLLVYHRCEDSWVSDVAASPSIFDLSGKADVLRTDENIAEQVQKEREGWGEP